MKSLMLYSRQRQKKENWINIPIKNTINIQLFQECRMKFIKVFIFIFFNIVETFENYKRFLVFSLCTSYYLMFVSLYIFHTCGPLEKTIVVYWASITKFETLLQKLRTSSRDKTIHSCIYLSFIDSLYPMQEIERSFEG